MGLVNGRSAWICMALMAMLAIVVAPARAQGLRSELYVGGLTRPVAFVQDPVTPGLQYVLEQPGRIRVIQNGTLLAVPFLDLTSSVLSGGERGLLGLAFAPDYGTSRRFFVNFTRAGDGHTVVARFRRSATDPVAADPSSRFDLMWSTGVRYIVQPASNHNGGKLAFGPDGFLYIGMGDGGGGGDPYNNAQNPDSLLGKMLRIDVAVQDTDPQGFDIPADNPFLDGVPISARPEIWAFGLRNPWQWSFDDLARGGTGALIIGDVGQSTWEEINYEPRSRGGRNYGWPAREGRDPYRAITPAYTPLADPIFQLGRSLSTSVTGGIIYRGSQLPATYRSRYFFANFYGQLYSLALTINPTTGEATASDFRNHSSEIGDVGFVSAFGVDSRGELYIVNWEAGEIIRIMAVIPVPPAATLVAPSGTIGTSTPAYRWNAVSASEWYYLWVSDATGPRVRQWFTAGAAGCGAGIGTCSVVPSTRLAHGNAWWWIQTWNRGGYGPWSAPLTLVTRVPAAVTLVSPSGTIDTAGPTYTWNASPLATWYHLWVTDSKRNVSQQWFMASAANCASGSGVCSVAPAWRMPPGLTHWWIQPWNSVGHGRWSAAQAFTVAPPAATALVAPSGNITTRTPAFTWNAVPRATYYYLWVTDSTGRPRIQSWHTAASVGCGGGAGACTIGPGVTLASGAATWWVQTWNDAGYGPWSAAARFAVP